MSLSTNIEQIEGDTGSLSDNNGHNEDEGTDDDRLSSSFLKLACQSCRLRKIRCDRNRPCAPCVRKNIECTLPTGVKVRERRQKTLVTSSYEERIIEISSKLDQLYHIINDRVPFPSRSQLSRSVSNFTTVSNPGMVTTSQQIGEAPDSDLEGEPALAAQAAFATSYAHRACSHGNVSQEMTLSLQRLEQMVREDQSFYRPREAPQQLNEPGSTVSNIEMPPLELTLSCIQELRISDSAVFLWTWDFDSIGQLLEYTTTVYTGKASIAEYIIVNSTLSRLLPICIRDEGTSSKQAELKMHARQCQINLDIILSRLPFNLTSNFDNVLALYQATIYAMDRGKTLTAWKFIAASIQMCHTLGYHREVALVPEKTQQMRRRKRLVWMIVIVDKCLSLRLGRPSSIRRSDFTLERLTDATQDDVSAIGPSSLLSKWIDFSLLQGRVFDDLYSPVALLQPESTRTIRARTLITDLRRVFSEITPAETQFYEARQRALGGDIHTLLCGADQINFLATLTLVYRVIPSTARSGSAFCEECVTMAHEALDEHQKCLVVLRNLKSNVVEMYLQWAFLSSPFIPFIVLFCRVFETCDPVHLEKLASVVETLSLLPDGLPEAHGHQLRIFKPMYEVAFNYIQANRNDQSSGPMVSDVDFDMIFREAAIGAEPNAPYEDWAQQQGQWDSSYSATGLAYLTGFQASHERQSMDPGTELGHWLDESQRVQMLLEDTL